MYSRDNSPRPMRNADSDASKGQFGSRGYVYRRANGNDTKRNADTVSRGRVYTENTAASRINPPPGYGGTAIRVSEQSDTYSEDTVSRYPLQRESESEFDFESDVAFPETTVSNSGQMIAPIIFSRRSNGAGRESVQNEETAEEYKVDDMIKLLKNADIDGEDLLLCAIIIMLLSSGCEEEIIMILAFLLFSRK